MSRVVLITGGGGGMGRAIGARFAFAGDLMMLSDVSEDALHTAVQELPGVTTVRADVTSVADCERIVAETIDRHGRLDVLINAAGVWVEGDSWKTTEDEWDHVIDVNLKGTFFACRHAIPHLIEAQGCIINLSSDSGLGGNPRCAVYNASKFGINGITRSLALELAPLGVRVNAVCPADVDTPMLAGQARDFGGDDPKGYLDELLARMPQGSRARFIQPDEVAALVVFLASAEAAPITGACIPVDWGVTAGY
jgi:NAD(P)-dependent dehydrogenase (short-subunit alcohol dehydrogenase family)